MFHFGYMYLSELAEQNICVYITINVYMCVCIFIVLFNLSLGHMNPNIPIPKPLLTIIKV